jgi:hypothetical protein
MGLLHWWFELPLKKSCGHSDGAPSSEVRGNGVVGPQEFLLEWRYAASPGVEMPGMVWGTSKFRFKSPVTCIPQAPGVGAAATGYTTKNDRNSNLFIHFISILLLPKKSNSSRIAELRSCALVFFLSVGSGLRRKVIY